MQHFLDQAQHSYFVRAVAAYLNIRLPCQRANGAVLCFQQHQHQHQQRRHNLPTDTDDGEPLSLRPYIRRLVATGHDSPSVLHAFFGDDWLAGVGPVWQQERFNYLFTAKSSGWAETKATYDMPPDEHVPFLQPLREPLEDELRVADGRWSDFLAMQDWMIGPRSPW